LKSRKLNLYSNLSNAHKSVKESAKKRHAKYVANMPSDPFGRLLYKLSPKHLKEYWFSREGALRALKIVGGTFLVFVVLIGALFIYFRKDLDAIRPGELQKRVQTTVTTYLDRNGELLWEDKGDGDYKLVVGDEGLNSYIKNATVAIEDKDFYKHGGVSASGLMRAAFNNLGGGSTQGGSTLTQQLVKQVFFADEAQQRGLSGIPRKIKEIILSIEVERMYNKAQILNLYLNESPYGGRRNGVESAAQTYFGHSAKKLTLAEAALLAAIPQNPSVYNPYYVEGHKRLIARQHTVLDNMVDQKYITKAEAKKAKEYPILDHVIPEADQYKNIKAPHFVQMVRAELEKELGKATVGKGGLIVKTTLDLRIQNKLEESMNDMFSSYWPRVAGFSNGAATVEDTKTGQIVAMMGSRDFNWPGYGQDNAATAYIQPGSSIKPLVYAELFQKKSGQNYGSGSILKDEKIDSIYGAPLFNADRTFKGSITIRQSLATSRNIPAVKAMYLSTVKKTLATIRGLGATSYCTQGDEVNVGLSSAIGSCGIKQVDLVNAYASLGRNGVYKKQSTYLEVKTNSGEVLKKWVDPAGKKIVDPQVAYIVSDILSDDVARSPLNGRNALGMVIPGVRTATKTGTSDKGGNAKDIWMASYSPSLSMLVWLGNSDATILRNGTSSIPGAIVAKVMSYAHKEVYAKNGSWKSGDWFTKPKGIQTVGGELYPSWWSKTQASMTDKIMFDKVSKKRASELTPEGAKVELEVQKMIDPITKKTILISPDGYDVNSYDDAHKSTDKKPGVTVSVSPGGGKNIYKISLEISDGTFPINNVQITIGGMLYKTYDAAGSYSFNYTATSSVTATVTAIDSGYYSTQEPTDSFGG